MTPHPAALEAYNRATFDPPTPELELAPAEEVQRDPASILRTIPKREIAGWFAVAALFVALAAGLAVMG